MTTTMTDPALDQTAEAREIVRLSDQLRVAQLTIAELRATLEAKPTLVVSYRQRRIHAQSVALARLNERVTNQRFVLRHIERLGRGLSYAELLDARALEA